MVTPLDFGVLANFSALFPFLLVLVFVYAVLSRTYFKDNPGLAGLIAVILAVLVMLTPIARKTIDLVAPWFVIFVIFAILMLLAFMTLGIKEESIVKTLTSKEHGASFAYWIIAVMLIILIGSLTYVISEERGFRTLTETANETGMSEREVFSFWATLTHPKVLGMILVLLVAYFTMSKLSKST